MKISTGPPPQPIPQTPGWDQFFNKFGKTHLVIDIFGYFTDSTATATEAPASSSTHDPDTALHAFTP